MPSAAMPEDLGLVLDIMELRRYARAKARVDAAKTKGDFDKLPAWDREWVMKVQEYNINQWRQRQSSSS